ncbi:DUF4012 domain-containing protein [Nocardioides sp.]|uniref:DUF4012 domain-containing protein n=1 Tax=Nocardioides sp. TaxID=35761 RepID=UPI00262CA44F|nr:DUF4012 domain-containing protein [Nocardioides sp.]
MKRPWRWVIGAVAAVVVLCGAYAGWLVWQVNKHLSAAADAAHALTLAVDVGNTTAVSRRLDEFAEEADLARRRTDSPMWGLFTHLPVLGDDAHGIRVVSRVAAGLGTGALTDIAGRVDELDALTPQGGGIDLSVVADLRDPVRAASRELSEAKAELDTEDPSHFVDALKLKYRDLQRQITSAADGLAAASRAVDVMPTMLGGSRPQNYLLVVQNNAEIRATGGLPGAVSVIRADHGRLSMVRQVAGGDLGVASSPVLPLTNAEVNAYGDLVGTFFTDANLQPDWGRASALMAARWKQVYDERIDGVLSLDPVALSYILKVTGPVTVDGTQLSAENVVRRLLHDVYVDLPDPADQDAYFRKVAAAIFARFTGEGASARTLLPALRHGVDERRVLVHSFDTGVQRELAGQAISGDVLGLGETDAAAPRQPQIGVYLNEGSSSKMSFYLRTKLRVTATSCAGGVQTYAAHRTVRNTATAAEVKRLPAYVKGTGEDNAPGVTAPVVQIYGPIDGAVTGLRVADAPDAFAADITDERRPIKQLWLSLKPGETQDVTWTMTSGPGQTGAAALAATPGVAAGSDAAVIRSAC